MLRFAAKRLLGAIPTLLLIVTLSFFLMRIAPGGPFDKERVVPPEIEARLIHAYHLDEPLPMQFLRYLGGLVQGDFGPSLKYKDFTVTELIAGGFPVSLRLGGIAVLLALIAGVAHRHAGRAAPEHHHRLCGDGGGHDRHHGSEFRRSRRCSPWSSASGSRWLPVGGWDGSVKYMILPVFALACHRSASSRG